MFIAIVLGGGGPLGSVILVVRETTHSHTPPVEFSHCPRSLWRSHTLRWIFREICSACSKAPGGRPPHPPKRGAFHACSFLSSQFNPPAPAYVLYALRNKTTLEAPFWIKFRRWKCSNVHSCQMSWTLSSVCHRTSSLRYDHKHQHSIKHRNLIENVCSKI